MEHNRFQFVDSGSGAAGSFLLPAYFLAARVGCFFHAFGRDHHPHCFTIWLAGGGIKAGTTYGATDDLGYFVTENKTGIHDLQATILHLLGIDAKKFSVPYQGLNQRLIGPTDEAKVIGGVLA